MNNYQNKREGDSGAAGFNEDFFFESFSSGDIDFNELIGVPPPLVADQETLQALANILNDDTLIQPAQDVVQKRAGIAPEAPMREQFQPLLPEQAEELVRQSILNMADPVGSQLSRELQLGRPLPQAVLPGAAGSHQQLEGCEGREISAVTMPNVPLSATLSPVRTPLNATMAGTLTLNAAASAAPVREAPRNTRVRTTGRRSRANQASTRRNTSLRGQSSAPTPLRTNIPTPFQPVLQQGSETTAGDAVIPEPILRLLQESEHVVHDPATLGAASIPIRDGMQGAEDVLTGISMRQPMALPAVMLDDTIPEGTSSMLAVAPQCQRLTSNESLPSTTSGAVGAVNNSTRPRQTKLRYSKGAAPSKYCHVCGRSSKTVAVALCGNNKLGLCRKVVCDKCLLMHQSEYWEIAKNPDLKWNCMHCCNTCPERARCHQYQRNNLKRRMRSAMNQAQTKRRRTSTRGAPSGTNNDNDNEAHTVDNAPQNTPKNNGIAEVPALQINTNAKLPSQNTAEQNKNTPDDISPVSVLNNTNNAFSGAVPSATGTKRARHVDE